MRKTTNYGLSLYDKEDKLNITSEENSLNANMEIIDSTLKNKASITDMTNYVNEHKDELKGADGKDGANGKDGISTTHSWNGTTLTVTSASGTSSANLKGDKGDKGDTGSKGNDGIGIKSVTQTTTSSADGGSNVITVTKTDGTTSTFTVKNGSKGSTGAKGADGYTPVKGTDYWTTSDKESIVAEVTSKTSIPDYVIEEAESVLDRVIKAQKNRCFTFSAISDLHYGNGNYNDGIIHACQAMQYINERIKLDMVAVLGDYTDGYTDSNYANATGDFKAINTILTDLRFSPNLRMAGNHDFYENNTPIINRFINCYSDEVVWGEISKGYYYKDFEGYKLRIICLNTAELSNGTVSVSEKQCNWFIDALNLASKEDVAEWQILILSHHPLDFWSNDSVYRLGNIVNAYKNGTSWSNGTVSCNFENKNTATLIGSIHGHIHNLLSDYMFLTNSNDSTKTSVLRMATPEACINRENQYDGPWKEPNSYPKTKNSATDTSFIIYCIDLDEKIIRAICYGAGYDRTRSYINEKLTFTITNNLTNVTSDNLETTIEENSSYTANLTATIGEIMSVVILMAGEDITNTCYSNGVINIENVTGDISINVVAREPEPETNYTNRIPISIDSNGAIYNGIGYKNGVRMGSDGTEKTQSTTGVTGYIEMKDTDIIYLKNCNISPYNNAPITDFSYIHFFDAEFNKLGGFKTTAISSNQYYVESFTTNDEGKFTSITYKSKYNDVNKNVKYVRFSMGALTGNEIITINEPIE